MAESTAELLQRAHARLVVCRDLTDEAQADCEVIQSLMAALSPGSVTLPDQQEAATSPQERCNRCDQPVSPPFLSQQLKASNDLCRFMMDKVRTLEKELAAVKQLAWEGANYLHNFAIQTSAETLHAQPYHACQHSDCVLIRSVFLASLSLYETPTEEPHYTFPRHIDRNGKGHYAKDKHVALPVVHDEVTKTHAITCPQHAWAQRFPCGDATNLFGDVRCNCSPDPTPLKDRTPADI